MPATRSLHELFEACQAGDLNKLKTLLQEWTVEGYGLPRNNDDVGLVELASGIYKPPSVVGLPALLTRLCMSRVPAVQWPPPCTDLNFILYCRAFPILDT
eukprot:TRINITY_DN34233_c0_g1_i1.p1 TRINITY_DN34233_c0_g1~~TRINITY_DN34233_c0_g1_i1.p1  ORF type:complete len:100 (-),score=6.81 TRINITY_DN34233_c0_g1_i1:7-306(-)